MYFAGQNGEFGLNLFWPVASTNQKQKDTKARKSELETIQLAVKFVFGLSQGSFCN